MTFLVSDWMGQAMVRSPAHRATRQAGFHGPATTPSASSGWGALTGRGVDQAAPAAGDAVSAPR